jgi:serine/threonine-protein kinase
MSNPGNLYMTATPPAPLATNVLNEPQAGDMVDHRFKILRAVNRGGMAAIYEALDTTTGKSVAVKVPFIHCECDPGFYERFQREETIGLTLDHPFVVQFVPCGAKKSRPYLVMEFLEGQTLAQRLRQSKSLPESSAARIASKVCEALSYLHRHGVIHRDLKPENIMLCADGTIRLMDFGIAKSSAARRLTFGGFSSSLGTPDYIAPEQVECKRGDARTDIYSLGAMLYVMTTGSAPFEGDHPYVVMNSRLSGDPEPPRRKNPELSPEMEEIILHAMERNPSDRFTSAVEMKTELDDYAKVALQGRNKKVRRPHVLSAYMPMLKKMAIILAAQAVLFFLLFWHYSHQHAGRTVSPATTSIVNH